MWIALTRAVPPSIDRCELTHLRREPIDHARAVREHEAYEDALRQLGCRVERLPDLPESPDSVFVEDTAIVVDRIAVLARPGAVSRRGEVESTAQALAKYRPLARIEAPGTLDGGDVLVTPGIVFVGVSGRTNAAGAHQLSAILAPHGYEVRPITVTECLHLKSAVTAIPPEGRSHTSTSVVSAFRRNPAPGRLLINPAWVDPVHFAAFELIAVDPAEPEAANVLVVGDRALCADAHRATRRRFDLAGTKTVTVPAGELAKAEGGLTCGCILLRAEN
jgi:dimethylargininase